MTKKRINLVTGAAGFIGARVSEMLLDAGESVYGVDNLNDYYDVALKLFRLERLRGKPNFQFAHNDIENTEHIARIFDSKEIDVVYHLAARAGVRYSVENPHAYFRTNVNGTLNILDAMQHNGVQKIVLASTSSLYAGFDTPFEESNPANTPLSPYASSKKAAEVLAYSYHHLYNIDVSVLRYFTAYGPMGRPDMAPFRFIKAILSGEAITIYGDGNHSRDFTYVDDIALATLHAGRVKLGYEIINIGAGNQPTTVIQFVRLIEDISGRKAVIVFEPASPLDMVSTQANIQKAKHMLGWRPTTQLKDGLATTIAHVQEYGW